MATQPKLPGEDPDEPFVEIPDPAPADSWQAHLAHAAALFTIARATWLPLLRGLGITSVSCTYDGSGDSGELEDPEFVPPATTLAETITAEQREAVHQLMYDALEQKFGGWENNEGAWGDLVWDITADTITIHHNARFMESNYYEEEL